LVLTPEDLRDLIERRGDIMPAEASKMADAVLSYFGYSTVIIDNAIASADRKMFYRLQDLGLLRSTWETVLLPSGKAWRIFYWELPKDVDEESTEPEEDTGVVYDTLPDEAWGRAGELG
jgi:hypothetical protein